MRNIWNKLSGLMLAGGLLLAIQTNAQVVVIDAGHGYTSDGGNPDGRTDTEHSTALSVSLKTEKLLEDECPGWTVHLTRRTRNGWIGINQRKNMSNSWGADRFISAHCNAGGGTGTETFWCRQNNAAQSRNVAFANQVQDQMVQYGDWRNRRVVECYDYLGYHFGVLNGNNAPAVLSEIGFVDSNDKDKLLSDSWRNKFAKAYQVALSKDMNKTCNGNSCPSSRNFTTTIGAGVYKSSGSITASAALANDATVVFDAETSVTLNIGFSASYANGNTFTAKLGGCSAARISNEKSLSDAEAETQNVLSDAENGDLVIYPNPSPSSEINMSFTLATASEVTIRVFNSKGIQVDVPANHKQYAAGDHVVLWNANKQHPDGQYFCAFESNGKTTTKKLLIRR